MKLREMTCAEHSCPSRVASRGMTDGQWQVMVEGAGFVEIGGLWYCSKCAEGKVDPSTAVDVLTEGSE